MKKFILFSLGVLFLTACAGNPPSWWNPGNVYSNSGKKQAPANQTSANLPNRETDAQEEQTLQLQDQTCEEMILTPLQDEEGENESGDASAQSVVPPEDTNALPLPSVLAE